MSQALVHTEILSPGVILVTLNRPDKRNALSINLMRSLCDRYDALERDDSVRVAILRGEGPVFCSGLDLAEAQNLELAEQSGELVARMLLTVHRSRVVTIATVHGAAVAGGAGLMTACDFVIAAEETRIGYPEVRRGLVASLVSSLLRRQIAERFVRELLVLGELVDAQQALEMGLIDRAVPKDEVLPVAREFAAHILKGAPDAIAHSRRLVDDLWPRPLEEDLSRALAHHKEIRRSQEALEGMRAFLEKRLPKWDPGA
ncbi:MAG: enoyl-CoA hydratase [Candidatus Hydrogenedentota bacterium]